MTSIEAKSNLKVEKRGDKLIITGFADGGQLETTKEEAQSILNRINSFLEASHESK